jgi:DnaA family protein
MSVQLPLGLSLSDSATFDNFLLGRNETAARTIQACAAGDEEPPVVYLWGGASTGKTHLLQAACHHAAEHGRTAAYVPLGRAAEFPLEVLEGLESMALVCIDDVNAVAGQPDWELALFSLFNRIRDQGGRLVVAAFAAPGDIGMQLPDLVSRLSWGPVFHLQELDDDEKLEALILRARRRGLELPAETGRYLMQHYPRNMNVLFGLLERLDKASLAAQRRLTLPFVKQTLED